MVGYVTDGTYSGTAAEYKAAWKAVASSCQPTIKMFYSPNIANLDAYEEWAPDEASTVDYVGVDYYPQGADELSASSYANKMQAFHDKYTGKDGASSLSPSSFSVCPSCLGRTRAGGLG